MGGAELIILGILYIVTSKAVLLDKARNDIKIEYTNGNMGQKLYILSMLPVHYMSK